MTPLEYENLWPDQVKFICKFIAVLRSPIASMARDIFGMDRFIVAFNDRFQTNLTRSEVELRIYDIEEYRGRIFHEYVDQDFVPSYYAACFGEIISTYNMAKLFSEDPIDDQFRQAAELVVERIDEIEDIRRDLAQMKQDYGRRKRFREQAERLSGGLRQRRCR